MNQHVLSLNSIRPDVTDLLKKKLYILYNQLCITNLINALSVNVIFFKSTHINSVLCRCFFVIYVLFQQNFCPNIYRLCAETYFYSRDYFICFRIDFSLTCRVVRIYFISIQVNLQYILINRSIYRTLYQLLK